MDWNQGVNTGGGVDLERLRNKVMEGQPAGRVDSPQGERRTALTFQAYASIEDWANKGEIARAVSAYNAGGTYNPASGAFLAKDFWLMRIFDAMEALGRRKFDKFVPGVWDSALALYRMTFSMKIEQAAPQRVNAAPTPKTVEVSSSASAEAEVDPYKLAGE